MSEYNAYSKSKVSSFNSYLGRVFSNVAIGLFITALAAFVFAHFYDRLAMSMGSSFIFLIIGLLVLELVVAITLSARINSLSRTVAWILYFVYSLLTGFSVGGVVITYTTASVWISFGVTALMFACMAIIGSTTKIDLSKFSGLILPAFIAGIVATLINVFFFRSQMFQWAITYLGIVLFLFLTAYDIQKLRLLFSSGFSIGGDNEKLVIIGALQLYLDFINLFLRILRIFGEQKNRR